MSNQVGETRIIGKRSTEGMTAEMISDEADDIFDLYEAMMHNTATCGLGRKYSGEDSPLWKKQREICEACGSCEEERTIRRRIDCRRKAAKAGKTLEMMCSACGKCE